MRWSPAGRALMGLGATADNVSVDGAVPSGLSGMTGGGWGWLDADTIAGPGDFGGGAQLWQYVLSTDTLSQIGSGDATAFAAGGGVWARYLTGAGVDTSVADFGPFPLSGPMDLDTDGRVALVLDASASRGLRSYSPAGALLAALDVVLAAGTADRVRARGAVVAFKDAGGWHLWNMSTGALVAYAPRVGVDVLAVVPVSVGATTYVVEASADAIWFRPAASATAFQLHRGSAIFNPDVLNVSGTLYVGWSTSAGEAPADLRAWRFSVKGVGDSGTTASGALVWTAASRLMPGPVRVGPVEAGTRPALHAGLEQHPVVDRHSLRVTPEWWKSLQTIAGAVSAPLDLSYVSGTLAQQHGGTGTATGTTDLNASNLLSGTVPHARKWTSYTLTSTGTANNVGFNTADEVRCANGAALTITGLVAGVAGQRLAVIAVEADAVTLAHESASSTAANRIHSFTGADLELAQAEGALLEYDATAARWRVLFVSSLGTGGDVVGPASSEDGAVALFDGTTGKLLREATLTGIAYVQSGVLKTCDVSVLTNGDASNPELIWDSGGDVLMTLQIH